MVCRNCRCNCLSSVRITARNAASTLDSGSSSRKIDGSMIAERPIATRCNMLTDSRSALRSSSGVSCSSSAMALTRRSSSGLRRAAHLQAIGEILAHRHMREDRVVLEDEADAAPAHRHAGHVAAAEQDAPAGRLLHAGDHVHGRRLAAARRPEQRHELAVLDGEVHGLQRGEVAEFLDQALQADGAHVRPPCLSAAMRFMAMTAAMDSTIRMASAIAAT